MEPYLLAIFKTALFGMSILSTAFTLYDIVVDKKLTWWVLYFVSTWTIFYVLTLK